MHHQDSSAVVASQHLKVVVKLAALKPQTINVQGCIHVFLLYILRSWCLVRLQLARAKKEVKIRRVHARFLFQLVLASMITDLWLFGQPKLQMGPTMVRMCSFIYNQRNTVIVLVRSRLLFRVQHGCV